MQTHNHNTHDKLTQLSYIAFMTTAREQKIADLVSVRKKIHQDFWVGVLALFFGVWGFVFVVFWGFVGFFVCLFVLVLFSI